MCCSLFCFSCLCSVSLVSNYLRAELLSVMILHPLLRRNKIVLVNIWCLSLMIMVTQQVNSMKRQEYGVCLQITTTMCLTVCWLSLKSQHLKCGQEWCSKPLIKLGMIRYKLFKTILQSLWFMSSSFSWQPFSLWTCSFPLLLISLMKKSKRDKVLTTLQKNRKNGSKSKDF